MIRVKRVESDPIVETVLVCMGKYVGQSDHENTLYYS